MAHTPDPYQQAVIDDIVGPFRHPLVVRAAAGSGKTGTVVRAYKRLVTEPKGAKKRATHPLRIWVLSFSNAAAAEIRERIDAALTESNRPPLPRAAPIGTFHGLALRILREDDPSFWTMEKCVDVAGIKSKIPSQRNIIWAILGWGRIKWLNGAKGLNVPEEIEANEYLTAIGWMVGHGMSPDNAAARKAAQDRFAHLPDLLLAWSMYENVKQRLGVWDFSDALVRFSALLDRKDVDIRWPHYVIVDEAQDSNVVQFEIARKLAAPRGKLVLVGDFWQAIYSWRGASPALFRDAAQHLEGAVDLPLSVNYRSGRKIVELSVGISGREVEARPHAPEGEVHLVPVGTDGTTPDATPNLMVDAIKAELDAGFEPKDVAVLLRTNAQLAVLEVKLHKRKVPVQVVGGTFWKRREVQTFVSYATILERPTYNALVDVINRPTRYLGRAFVDDLWNNASSGRSLADAMRATNTAGARLGPNQIRSKNAFADWLDRMAQAPWANQADQLASMILGASPDQDPESPVYQRVQESMSVLVGMARESASPRQFTSTTQQAEERSRSREAAKNAVTLMTAHGAKGLEWPIVMTDISGGVFPSPRALQAQLDGNPEALEEEYRLFYVTATRPKAKFIAFESTPGLFSTYLEPFARDGGTFEPRKVLPFPVRPKDDAEAPEPIPEVDGDPDPHDRDPSDVELGLGPSLT